MENKYKIVPINPFTPRQAEIIELKFNGLSNREVAAELGISPNTVVKHIQGERGFCKPTKSTRGILGNIERATGERPVGHNWRAQLFNDVVFPK